MDRKTKAAYEARANIIKAMGHPTRLYIVDVLSRGKRCVRELTDAIAADMSTVSKHLSILKSVGIIQDQKSGPQVYYTLKMPCVLNFFNCVESVLETTAREQLKLVK